MKNPHSRFRYGKTCVRATTAGSEKGGGLSNILRSALKKRLFFKIVPVGLLKLELALSRLPPGKKSELVVPEPALNNAWVILGFASRPARR